MHEGPYAGLPSTDQLFKEAIQEFLPEFVQLFFPAFASQIDWERGIVFRDKELFTDFPAGDRREADLIAEVSSLTGEPEILLIHAEVQGKRQAEFAFRMWQYYALLRLRTALPVLPLVIYLSPSGSGDSTENRETYTETLFGEEFLRFQYGTVSLPDLSADDWQERSGTAGVLAAALTSVMRPGRKSRARLKFNNLARIATSNVNEARRHLLAMIVETFLPLSARRDQAEFAELLVREAAAKEVEKMISPYEERGIQQGLQQGLQQGVLQGRREILLHILRSRFGSVPESVALRVTSMNNEDEIMAAVDRVLAARSLEEAAI